MPEPTVVCNTSPLLYLHQIRHLDLLRKLYRQLVVPSAVDEELAAGRAQGVDVPALSDLPWIELRWVSPRAVDPSVKKLGAGEAAVITLGLQIQPSLLILDDQTGRRAAAASGLTFTGTLGVLIKAKRDRLIEAVSPILEQLSKTTMWLTEDLLEMVRDEAGEI